MVGFVMEVSCFGQRLCRDFLKNLRFVFCNKFYFRLKLSGRPHRTFCASVVLHYFEIN